MKIENNIIKHYLKDVYFITGTAYAGKSTTVKMLAERYGMILCGENYHMDIANAVATPDTHPDICYNKMRMLPLSLYSMQSKIALQNFPHVLFLFLL